MTLESFVRGNKLLKFPTWPPHGALDRKVAQMMSLELSMSMKALARGAWRSSANTRRVKLRLTVDSVGTLAR